MDLQEGDSDLDYAGVESSDEDEDYVPSRRDSVAENESEDIDVQQQQRRTNVTATPRVPTSPPTPTVFAPPSTPQWSDIPTMQNIPFTKTGISSCPRW